MTTVSSNNNPNPRVLFWLAWPIFFGVVSLAIVGLWHRDNNYGVRPGDYSLRVIDSTEFAKLSPEQTARWDLIPDSDKYVQVVIENPFVFSHVLGQVLPVILFAIVALISYLWCHGLPQGEVWSSLPLRKQARLNRSLANKSLNPTGNKPAN